MATEMLYRLLNFVGMLYLFGMVLSLVLVDIFYACPIVFGFYGCILPVSIGLFMVFSVVLNCLLFHIFARNNRVERYFSFLQERYATAENGQVSFYSDLRYHSTHGMKLLSSCVVSNVPTKYCDPCQLTVPSRSYHCPVCNYCVLRCDHHCFIVNGCVGFGNQRYFIVLLFWTMFGALLGIYILGCYLVRFYHSLLPFGWLQYLIPVLFYNSLWLQCVSLTDFLLVLLFNLGFVAFCVSALFFIVQWICILKGRRMQRLLVQEFEDSLTPRQRIKSVFGPYWALNFIFPMPFQNSVEYLHEYFQMSAKDL